MLFSKRNIAMALAAAAMGVAAQAHAFDISVPANRAVDQLQFRISGATASTGSLDALFTLASTANPCNNDADFTKYVLKLAANSAVAKDSLVWTCTLRAGSDFLAKVNPARVANGQATLVGGEHAEFYKSDTGSGGGTNPFAPDATYVVKYPVATSMTTTACSLTTGTVGSTPLVRTCTGLVNAGDAESHTIATNLVMGTSDVEAKLFGVNSSAYTKDGGSLIWGLPVSIDLRNALQAAQFATTSHCHPSNVDYTAASTHVDGSANVTLGATPVAVTWGESESCMPSLSREVVDSLLSGQITDWRRLRNAAGATINTPATAAGIVPPGNDYAVKICRRGDNSGTQASYKNIYMREAFCETDTKQFSTATLGDVSVGSSPFSFVTCEGFGAVCGAPAGTFFGTGATVIPGPGGGNVSECLSLFSQTVASNTDGWWAIGINSSEFVADDASAGAVTSLANRLVPNKRYRHIKVNGFAPTLYNGANSYYPYFSEAAVNTHSTIQGVIPLDVRKAVVDSIAAAISTPSILVGLNSGFIHTFGQGGFMAPMDSVGKRYPSVAPDPVTTYPLNAAEVSSFPLIALSKHPLGHVNNCQEPVHVGGTQFVVMPELSTLKTSNASNSTADTQVP